MITFSKNIGTMSELLPLLHDISVPISIKMETPNDLPGSLERPRQTCFNHTSRRKLCFIQLSKRIY